MKKLNINDIDSKHSKKITTQSYSSRTSIEDVKIIELRLMTGEDGSFVEAARLDKNGIFKDFPEFQLAQISYSNVLAGGIKAWHLHFNQEDLWFVPAESHFLIGLVDLRKKSKTKGVTMRLSLGNHKAHLLYIPRGVAHGIANISKKPSSVFYFMNQEFDINKPDEHRLPWNYFGEDFWKIKKG